MRLHHLAIQVPDLEVAEGFYAGVLGLRVTRRQEHALWLDAGGTILMLERCVGAGALDPWASPAPGPFVVALEIGAAERAGWLTRLEGAGVAVDHTSGFTIYFRDPWGCRLALSHYPAPAG